MTQNKNQLKKKFATLAARAFLVCPISLLFAPKTALFWQNLHYFSGKAWELKMVILHIFAWSFSHTKQKTISKKVCNFGCQSCFCMPNFTAFCPKNSQFLSKTVIFWQNPNYFSGKAWELKMLILHIITWSFGDPKQKSIKKKVCNFCC